MIMPGGEVHRRSWEMISFSFEYDEELEEITDMSSESPLTYSYTGNCHLSSMELECTAKDNSYRDDTFTLNRSNLEASLNGSRSDLFEGKCEISRRQF